MSRVRSDKCPAFDANNRGLYGYQPTLAAGIVFTILFASSAILHSWQTFKTKRWWMILFTLGALGEALGWAARAAASRCIYNVDLFEMQIALLIFSPAFTSAAIYTILVLLVAILGRHTSLIRSRLYLWIFVVIDIISLLLQAIGGGMAASSAGAGKDPKLGTNIMIAGITFQLASLCVFTFLFLVVLNRGRDLILARQPLQLLAGATLFSTLCMIIRGIYRTIELIQGWTGYLMLNERYQIALDGTMIILSLIVFNIINPGVMLPKGATPLDKNEVVSEHESQDKP